MSLDLLLICIVLSMCAIISRRIYVTESFLSVLINDVFGKQIGSTYCEGLVDAESEDIFISSWKRSDYHGEKRKKKIQVVSQASTSGSVGTNVKILLQEC